MASVDEGQDVIDSRDVIERIEELEGERDSFEPEAISVADLADPALAVDSRPPQTWEEANPDEAEELKALRALQSEAEGYSDDWHHGASIISDSYFEDYARDLAEDLHGAALRNASWPFDCIDWTRAADELKQDYTQVTFGTTEYWVR